MPIQRLNHAVLYVTDVARSVEFYGQVLGFRVVPDMVGIPNAAFLQAEGSTNDHDLGLFGVGPTAEPAGGRRAGLYHLAWEVDTLGELQRIAQRLQSAGALAGASDHSTTKALYAKDPDGIEFEVSWLVPAELIDDATLAGRTAVKPLDLQAEIVRYGADTRGGVGVSTRT